MQTTGECLPFQSHDKDGTGGGHTILSVTSKNAMLHANFMALSSEEPQLLLTVLRE